MNIDYWPEQLSKSSHRASVGAFETHGNKNVSIFSAHITIAFYKIIKVIMDFRKISDVSYFHNPKLCKVLRTTKGINSKTT
jgi:hypothetical protein